MTKKDLIEKIKRRLGAPMIKVELDEQQIVDAIDYSRSKWIKWAVGNATQEVYFTIPLSAGQDVYDLPIGVTEVLNYEWQTTSTGSINTLFTLDNFLYNEGLFESLYRTSGDDYTLVSYHIARDWLETLRRYTPDKYNWKYHKYHNQLEIHPAPSVEDCKPLTVTDENGNPITINSPGYILLRTMMFQGSTYQNWEMGDSDADFYGEDWIFDYALAECKIMLGRIRSKFSQFASLGNAGLALDGETLISEGIEEKRELKEALQLEEVYEGLGIIMG